MIAILISNMSTPKVALITLIPNRRSETEEMMKMIKIIKRLIEIHRAAVAVILDK